MKSTVIFSTKNQNSYAYDTKSKYLFYIHPILNLIWQYALYEKNQIKEIVSQTNHISDADFEYYYQKYLFLQEHGIFSEIDSDRLLTGRVTKDIVEKNLANLNQLVFQVTNDCNLKCKYCCFGDLYNGPEIKTQYMDISTVHSIFSFLIPYWKQRSSLCKNTINIGFYGGEPLLNISLIKEIISYCKQVQERENIEFEYSMTTNATLLPRYIDYLVEHRFNLLISLDGNEYHDSYRVDKNNHSTFQRVFNNIKYVQVRYCEYFKENVYFNSVLTDKSSVEEIHDFIYKNFQKTPLIEPVSTTDLKDSEIANFKQISQEYNEDIELLRERGDFSNIGKEIGRFFYYNLNNSFHHYADLLYKMNSSIYKKVPTGTCLPFWKKMYITSRGDIMVCEKIAMSHIWGHVEPNKVFIDFERIIQQYNMYFDGIRERCQKCYRFDTCPVCIFQLKMEKDKPLCPYSISQDSFKNYLSNMVDILERDHQLFYKFNDLIFA